MFGSCRIVASDTGVSGRQRRAPARQQWPGRRPAVVQQRARLTAVSGGSTRQWSRAGRRSQDTARRAPRRITGDRYTSGRRNDFVYEQVRFLLRGVLALTVLAVLTVTDRGYRRSGESFLGWICAGFVAIASTAFVDDVVRRSVRTRRSPSPRRPCRSSRGSASCCSCSAAEADTATGSSRDMTFQGAELSVCHGDDRPTPGPDPPLRHLRGALPCAARRGR